jgi:hypothetical protein
MKTINPENWVTHTIADRISPIVLGKLHDPAETECAQSSIVEARRAGDICDTDACMINHADSPSFDNQRAIRLDADKPPAGFSSDPSGGNTTVNSNCR